MSMKFFKNRFCFLIITYYLNMPFPLIIKMCVNCLPSRFKDTWLNGILNMSGGEGCAYHGSIEKTSNY